MLSSSLSFCSKEKNNTTTLLGLEYQVSFLLKTCHHSTLLQEKYSWEHQNSTLSSKWICSLQVPSSILRYTSLHFKCFFEYICTLLLLVMLLGFAGMAGPSEMVAPDTECQKIKTNCKMQSAMTCRQAEYVFLHANYQAHHILPICVRNLGNQLCNAAIFWPLS